MAHILLARDEVVVMDMEAGIEHLGRGTAAATDKLIVVVEPGRRSVETAHNIKRLAEEIGLTRISLVGNKIRGKSDQAFLEEFVTGFDWLGFLPYDEQIIECDLSGGAPYDTDSPAKKVVGDIAKLLFNEEPEHCHRYVHEHTHEHSHEYQHERITHTHTHSHTHVHGLEHVPNQEYSDPSDVRSHEHEHSGDHGANNYDHGDQATEPHERTRRQGDVHK
jgi:hypothetical protein